MANVIERARKLRTAVAGAVTSGGAQNFLGAPWVSALVRHTPPGLRTSVALRLLAASPHYFFTPDLQAEHARCLTQREGLTEQLLTPFLSPDTVALDYGCGPGYMAVAVARRVRRVEAVDISSGVLACAAVLNAAPNIEYETSTEAATRNDQVEIAYSFAVVQHLTDDTFREALLMLKRRVRPEGTLVLHFATPNDGWRTEQQWRDDTSLHGRAKLRFGLNCFGRGTDHFAEMVAEAGFTDIRIEPLAGLTDADADLASQYWLVATA